MLFGTTSYAISTVLSIFFLGLGVGSLWGGRLADRSKRPLQLYALFEILIGVWALVFVFAIDWGEAVTVGLLRAWATSRIAGIVLRGILAAVLLAVPVVLMGATLPLLARFVSADSRARGLRIGTLYSVNTFGAMAGCALTGFLLLPWLGYTRATLLGALANGAIGLIALAWAPLAQRTPAAPPSDLAKRLQRLTPVFVVAGLGILTLYAFAYQVLWPPLLGVLAPGLAVALLSVVRAGRGGADAASAGGDMVERGAIWPERVVLAAFAVSGFCAIALEVLWTRLLTIVFLGTTYAFTTMLAALLYGIAVGSALASSLADRRKHPVALFGAVEMGIGVSCVAMLAVFAWLPEKLRLIQEASGHEWGHLVQAKFFLSFVALFVPTFLFGMTFPLVVRTLARRRARLGRDVGALYFANTIGGVFGAIAGGYVIIPMLGAHHGIVALAWVLFGVGALLVLSSPAQGVAPKAAMLTIGVLLMVAAAYRAPADITQSLSAGYMPGDHRIIEYRDGVEGTVAVSEPVGVPTGSDRVLWINAVQATVSIEKGVKMNRFQGVLPLLFDRDPKTVLFMCFGSGITAGTLALSDFERIDAVEISADVLEMAPFFETDNFGVIDNPKVNLIVDDGRNFLLTTENDYDIITFEPMPLALAGVSTFYTQEYYGLCLDHLTPGGLVSQWVPLHSLDGDVVRSLIYTFTDVFPEYCAWFVNSDLFLIGSNEPLWIDYAKARARLSKPAVDAALRDVGLGDLIEVLSCFFMGGEAIDAYVKGGNVMTDDRPWAEFVAPKLIYERTVQDTLGQIQPFFESVLPLLRLDGVAEAERAAIAEAIDRRYRSKCAVLDGLQIYYGGAFGGDPGEDFRKALAFDPGDLTARYYVKEIAVAEARGYRKRGELDAAAKALTDALAYVPNSPALFLMLGDVRFEQGRGEEALRSYRRYVDVGGANPRALERMENLEIVPQ
ncbi:MAG: tetratricopeptide repeat protein [Nitrospiraceae bacterium]|nr:tetratricopeptide repeat protein [Nitrospiraceae bacterium]